VPGPIEFFIWCACFVLEVAVVVCAIRANVFRRYLPLNLYMAASAIGDILRFRILFHYGYTSREYFYFYYYSDALLTVALYLALISLFIHVFKELGAEKLVIFGACCLLILTSLFSYFVIQQSRAACSPALSWSSRRISTSSAWCSRMFCGAPS